MANGMSVDERVAKNMTERAEKKAKSEARHTKRVAHLESRATQLKSTLGGIAEVKTYHVHSALKCDCCGSAGMKYVVALTSHTGTKLRVGRACAALITGK